MYFDFSQREPVFGKIIFVLCLDRKKMKERIIIGEAAEVLLLLDKGIGNVYYDGVHTLGQMLIDFESDKDRLWNVNAMGLHESYQKLLKRWTFIEKFNLFLQEKYKNGTPIVQYAAMRTWYEYLNCYNKNHGADIFLDRVAKLYRPFHLYSDCKPWQEPPLSALDKALFNEETQIEIWYPNRNRGLECAVAYSSFQPVIFYYLKRIEDWGLTFQQCKICGRYFLARSKRYELCSDKCRAVQARDNKRQFDERTSDIFYEKAYDTAYDYWYNRLRKVKKDKTANSEKIAAVKVAFDAFRAEAVRRKSEVKSGKVKVANFTSWLAEQRTVVDKLME